ncbi:MAG: DUF2752 domain-containing protein [Oscillospiraceae bacterium]
MSKFRVARLLVYTAALLFFLLPPLSFFEAESWCVFYRQFGLLCPMCGATRSLANFLRLDFMRAFSYNQVLAAAVYPVAAILVIQDVFVICRDAARHTKTASMLEFSVKTLCRMGVSN